MQLPSIVGLAVGLALDAAAVSAARGVAAPALTIRHALIVAIFFGGSQAAMPALGFWIGRGGGEIVAAFDHWIAFVLLSGIGAKMLHDARAGAASGEAARGRGRDLFAAGVMLALAVSTSIDAFAVGLMLPVLGAPFGTSIATIGLITAVLSVAALWAGRRLGLVLGRRLDAAGGLVLVALGIKILVEHLSA